MDIEERDHRVYVNDFGTPTIQLGRGDVGVLSLNAGDGSFAGVGFSLLDAPQGIGSDTSIKPMTTAHEAKSILNIIATKPESIDVIIEELTKARAKFGKRLDLTTP